MRFSPQQNCRQHEEAAKQSFQIPGRHWQGDEAPSESAKKNSQRAQNSCSQIDLALLPVFSQSPQSDGGKQNEKRSTLRQVLVHAEQVNQRRHQYHPATNTQKAHQHTDSESEQENEQSHGLSVCGGFIVEDEKPCAYYLPLSRRRRQPSAETSGNILGKTGFLCLLGNCYSTCLCRIGGMSCGPERRNETGAD
jgi:hypothetical protein